VLREENFSEMANDFLNFRARENTETILQPGFLAAC